MAVPWLVPPAPLALAEAMLRADRPWMAVATLEALDPDDPRVRRDLGRALAGAGQCERALPYLLEARSRGWTATDAYYEGACHERAGDLSLAIASWSEAVAIDPRHAWSWYRLARAADALPDPALAEVARGSLWTLDGGPLLTALADARRAVLADDPDADLLLAELSGASRDPRVAGELALLDGRRWLALGWPERAVDALTRAVALRPADPEAAIALARAWWAAGDAASARAALERPLLALQDPPTELVALRARLAAEAP